MKTADLIEHVASEAGVEKSAAKKEQAVEFVELPRIIIGDDLSRSG